MGRLVDRGGWIVANVLALNPGLRFLESSELGGVKLGEKRSLGGLLAQPDKAGLWR